MAVCNVPIYTSPSGSQTYIDSTAFCRVDEAWKPKEETQLNIANLLQMFGDKDS